MDEIKLVFLRENWNNETNEPYTQEWRDDLTEEEAAIVESWDDAFETAYQRAFDKIRGMEG